MPVNPYESPRTTSGLEESSPLREELVCRARAATLSALGLSKAIFGGYQMFAALVIAYVAFAEVSTPRGVILAAVVCGVSGVADLVIGFGLGWLRNWARFAQIVQSLLIAAVTFMHLAFVLHSTHPVAGIDLAASLPCTFLIISQLSILHLMCTPTSRNLCGQPRTERARWLIRNMPPSSFALKFVGFILLWAVTTAAILVLTWQ